MLFLTHKSITFLLNQINLILTQLPCNVPLIITDIFVWSTIHVSLLLLSLVILLIKARIVSSGLHDFKIVPTIILLSLLFLGIRAPIILDTQEEVDEAADAEKGRKGYNVQLLHLLVFVISILLGGV